MKKTKINEEIEDLKRNLEGAEDLHPDYLPSELKDLQVKVIIAHAHIENVLELRIAHKIATESGISPIEFGRGSLSLQKLIRSLSFRNKLEIISSFGDKAPYSIIGKINTYRIEFAHPKGMELRKKYNYNQPAGKINIRNLLRCLCQGKDEANKYVVKFFK